MMLLDLLILAIFAFFITCILFIYYHQSRHEEREAGVNNAEEKASIWYRVASFLWSATSWWLACIDQLLMNCVSYYLSHNLHGDLFIDNIAKSLKDTCAGRRNATVEELTRLEISELSNTICELYIDFWYRNISLEDSSGDGDEENFKVQCKKGLDEAFFNFYNLCNEQIDTKKLALQLVKQVEAHLTVRNADEVQLGTKEEISLLLNLIDNIFVRVLPADVNAIVTNCDCCRNRSQKNCLQESNNPVRLFIYNLLIYSLLLPLINRISNPLYFFFYFIYIVSHLGGISLDTFLSQFDDSDFFAEERQTESLPVQVHFESEGNGEEKALFYEAIEESRKELLIFTNIGIPDVKISTNNNFVSSMSKINPYIDYIILFNVLECDQELEAQKGNQMRFIGNGQTFLQRTYQVKRRFREFLSFQQTLEKNPEFRVILSKIENKPSNIQFHSTSFFNYIKSTKINEHSPLVRLRRDCLESFLIQLSHHKLINESREFCEFLGYKYKSMLEVKQLLKATTMNEELQGTLGENSLTKNFELNFKNIKDIFKIFLPVQAKLGQAPTQIEDVVVNDQICSKYSIAKIETECSEGQNHMVLKLKLDKWAANLGSVEQGRMAHPSRRSKSNTEDSQLDHQILSCLFVVLFQKYITAKAYVVERCESFTKSIFKKLRRMFTFNRLFRFYLHYLHVYLNGMESEVSLEVYLNSYDRFFGLLQERDLRELFQLYVRQSEEKIRCECYDNSSNSGQPSGPTAALAGRLRLCLHTAVSYLCDHLNLFDNLFASFDTQHSNKLLIYRLLQVFLNEVKKA